MSDPVAVTIQEASPVYVTLTTGGTGPPGPASTVPGPQGPAGPPGSSYVFNQGVSSSSWHITHNLGKFPSVVVQDTANDEVEGDIEYVDSNSLVISFNAAFSGKAYLN